MYFGGRTRKTTKTFSCYNECLKALLNFPVRLLFNKDLLGFLSFCCRVFSCNFERENERKLNIVLMLDNLFLEMVALYEIFTCEHDDSDYFLNYNVEI